MTTEDKQTLGMDEMFAHGNEPLPTTVENPLEPIRTEPEPAALAGGPTRDDQGRFASPQPAPAAASQAPVTSEAVQTDADAEKQPITKAEFKGMLEEREKRQAAQARADAAEARLRQIESQQQPTQIPSGLNPDEVQQYVQNARTGAVFDFSEKVARKEHGDDTVQAAMDWGLQRSAQNPAFQAEYLRQEHPIDWAVKQYKRDKILTELGDDADSFIEKRVAARLAALGHAPAALPQTDAPPSQAASPQPAPIPIPASQAPTRSIANATSAGGLQVVPPQGEFAALDLVHKH